MAERISLLLLEAGHLSEGARMALAGVLAFLLVALGFLIACAWMMRRAERSEERTRDERARQAAEDLRAAVLDSRRDRTRLPPLAVCSDQVEATGIMAKICPSCRSRHDLAATVCGEDGSELAVLN